MSLKKLMTPVAAGTESALLHTVATIMVALSGWSASLFLSPAAVNDIRLVSLRAVTAAFAACAFMTYWKLRRVRRQNTSLLMRVRELAAGQLDAVERDPVLREHDHALDNLRTSVSDVVVKVRNQTAGFAQTSGLLSTDNKTLLNRTDRQRELLEQTASSTEQITVAVRQTAENARHADEMVASAARSAARASGVVTNVEVAMAAIRESSAKISAITDVVNGIAFQTNILALNAAVEAARAGDAGRGFSVVASEVRVLAQRVATASGEIKALIKDSVEKVQAGHNEARLAGTSMRDIEGAVKDIAGMMTEICTSSLEQSVGVERINDALLQLDRMTHEDAHLAEEIASAANSLHHQAISLTNVVARFNVGSGEFGNRDDAVALVEAAIIHANVAGIADLCQAINDLASRKFADRDLYLVVARLDGEIVAHGGNPRLVGLDTRKLLDADGKAFGNQLLAVSRTRDNGWVDFRFAHPITREVEAKSAYVKRYGDFFVSCGFYLQTHRATPETRCIESP